MNLTKQKLAEEDLLQKEERLRLALAAARMATWDWHVPSGNVIWNEMHYRMMGYEPGEITPTYDAWASRVHPDDIDAAQKMIQQCMTERRDYTSEFRTLWPDGTISWLEACGEFEFDNNNQPFRCYGVMIDVTERKRADEELKKMNSELEERVVQRTAELREKDQMLLLQSRQAAMGEMIGNISHQWRQPLNILGLQLQQLPLFYDLGQFNKELLDKNVAGSMAIIKHMSKTIDDFRNYFKPDKDKTEFNVHESIKKCMSLLEGSLKNPLIDVEIVSNGDSTIYGYANEFAQVILNIMNNARDVFIERNVTKPEVHIKICNEERCVVVTVADNAGGIPEDIINKVFDPYFTTKGPQQGTGVGLFMSKSIIEKNMGGRLQVRNLADGAEFRIEVLNESPT